MKDAISSAQLHELTERVWSMVLGFRIQPKALDLTRADSEAFVVGRVMISGAWRGAVTLGCSSALARHAAATMFGKPDAEADAGEIRDALGELTNMVGGNFKTLLKGDCKLSVPSVLDTVRLAEVNPSPTEHLWFECEGGMVLVNVAREQKNGVAP
jgi:chemotaxis protein CheX